MSVASDAEAWPRVGDDDLVGIDRREPGSVCRGGMRDGDRQIGGRDRFRA